MKIDWRFLGPHLLKSTALAFAFSVLIHVTSNVHFLVAATILLAAWPVTDFVIEAIASKNPSAAEGVIVKSWWPVAVKYILVLLVTGALWYWVPLPFMTAFAYALLALASIGAINGIVIEWEDNAPGGWLNPKSRK